MQHRMKLTFLLFALTSIVGVLAGPYKTLLAPISKDTTTSLHTLTLNSGDPFVIDINTPFLWRSCGRKQPPVACSSPTCSQGRAYLSSLCASTNYSFYHGRCVCNVKSVNLVTKTYVTTRLTFSDIVVHWSNEKNPVACNTFKNIYVSRAPNSLLNGLTSGSSVGSGFSRAP